MTEEKAMSLKSILAENVRLRISFLDTNWEALANASGEEPRNVRNWVKHGTPTLRTLERLADLLGVPAWSLLDPNFNPKEYERPEQLNEADF